MFASASLVLRRSATRKIHRRQQELLADAAGIHSAWRLRDTPRLDGSGIPSASCRKPTKTVVLNDLHETVDLTSSLRVSAMQLWNSSRIAREKADVRNSGKVFVVGGAETIKRIWHTYRIRPNVVYVPDTEENVPSWCTDETLLPSVIVRTSPVDINRQLLSAEHNDGYGAEFPMPAVPLIHDAAEKPPSPTHPAKLNAVLVLHKVMIPSNVGVLCRAAVERGFDAVVLCGCADAYGEKVIRGSQGFILDPRLKVFQLPAEDNGSEASVLQQMAQSHDLLPLFAVPSNAAAEPVFQVASKYHGVNRSMHQQSQGRHLGVMLIMGSEAKGLHALEAQWTMPYQPVSIPMQNTAITSINVGVAGSILMQHFRPGAAAEYEALSRVHLQLEGVEQRRSLPQPAEVPLDNSE